MTARYLVALGSNMRVAGIGGPRQVVETALAAIAARGIALVAVSRVIDSAPVGPSLRRYANAAALVATGLEPMELLSELQALEHDFGRRRRGQRWRARPLDLDIVLWSGGVFAGPGLVVPHPRFRERGFVLGPAAHVAPGWRDPLTGLSLRQLAARAA